MSAEATSATGSLLLAQEVGQQLVAAQQRINELEAQLEERDRTCELLAAALDRLDPERP